MEFDMLVVLPIATGAAIMIRWTQAYLLFPRAVEKIMVDVDVGPFRDGLVGVKNFVRFCAHSHWIMALRDIAMIFMMYLHFSGVYEISVGILMVTLIPLFIGSEYSMHVCRGVYRDAAAINKFIRTANQVTGDRAHGIRQPR